MDKAELIYLATIAFEKNMDFEKFMYSDYMYGKEDQTEDVFEYMNEIEDYGVLAFKEKYKLFNMFI